MDFDIVPLDPKDVDEFTAVHWAAFSPPEVNMTIPMIYPLGFRDDLKARLRNRILKAMDCSENTFCDYVRDPATGQMIGVSWWSRVDPQPQDREAVDARFLEGRANRRAGVDVEGMNQEMEDAFFKAAFDTEAEIMDGQAYMTLKQLAVHPEYARQGVGTLLLKHGLRKVDELDLPAFVHGGTLAKPLYERHGFKALRKMPANALDYGGRSDALHWCMLRQSRSAAETDSAGQK